MGKMGQGLFHILFTLIYMPGAYTKTSIANWCKTKTAINEHCHCLFPDAHFHIFHIHFIILIYSFLYGTSPTIVPITANTSGGAARCSSKATDPSALTCLLLIIIRWERKA